MSVHSPPTPPSRPTHSMTGINTVIFYSTTIFALAGVENAFLGTVMVGVLNVVITTLSGYLVDKAGRKILLTRGKCVGAWPGAACICIGACCSERALFTSRPPSPTKQNNPHPHPNQAPGSCGPP